MKRTTCFQNAAIAVLLAGANLVSGAQAETVTVRPGQSLSMIAQQYLGLGDDWFVLCEANRERVGPDCDNVQPGTVLVLPDRANTRSGRRGITPRARPTSLQPAPETVRPQAENPGGDAPASQSADANASQTPTAQPAGTPAQVLEAATPQDPDTAPVDGGGALGARDAAPAAQSSVGNVQQSGQPVQEAPDAGLGVSTAKAPAAQPAAPDSAPPAREAADAAPTRPANPPAAPEAEPVPDVQDTANTPGTPVARNAVDASPALAPTDPDGAVPSSETRADSALSAPESDAAPALAKEATGDAATPPAPESAPVSEVPELAQGPETGARAQNTGASERGTKPETGDPTSPVLAAPLCAPGPLTRSREVLLDSEKTVALAEGMALQNRLELHSETPFDQPVILMITKEEIQREMRINVAAIQTPEGGHFMVVVDLSDPALIYPQSTPDEVHAMMEGGPPKAMEARLCPVWEGADLN